MRVVLDARLYGLHHRGLGRYLVELVRTLVSDQVNEYVLLVDPKVQLPQLPINFRTVHAPWRVYSLGEQLHLPRLIRKLKPDVVHYPHFALPLLSPTPYVVTIHDLILHRHASERATTLPSPLYWIKVALYRAVVWQALRRASRIMTVSRAVAQDVARYYPWTEHKISVVPLAPGTPEPGVLLQLPNQYLLVVGAAYPHKNLELVLGALLEVRLTRPDCKLIVVGRGDTFMEGLKKTTQSMGLEAHILFWGEATEAELATLYESAAAYLVPSLSEGFGLGAVEALTHGTPVVAADIPVFHEVLGQAAVFIDPASVTSLVHGIERALEPKVREDLRQAARPMLARLSWQKVGRLTREVYESCVEE